jgi:hypothetical protein
VVAHLTALRLRLIVLEATGGLELPVRLADLRLTAITDPPSRFTSCTFGVSNFWPSTPLPPAKAYAYGKAVHPLTGREFGNRLGGGI